MAFAEYIPGMKTGSTKRNLVMGILYIALLPVLSTLSFIWAPIYVGLNYNGIASELCRIPGISPQGGIKSALVVFLYLVLISFGPRLIGWLGII